MACIEPFRALRYDPARVAPSHVATQPYDKISPEMQERYYATSPYNLVRIILGKRNANDGPGDNPYTRAASFFKTWRDQKILLADSQPSIYRYVQQFSLPSEAHAPGVQVERQGFIALGRLEDYSAGIIFRHEQTLAKPKADRLELLRATKAHFGQIFMLYSDPDAEIESAVTGSHAPAIEIRDEYGVLHRVWRISDSGIIEFVREKMCDRKLIIADGHHRYETALTYRNECRAQRDVPTPGAPHEFAMMTFVNMDTPGLLILPTHRVVYGLTNFSMDSFRAKASEFFSVEEADLDINSARASVMLREAAHTGTAILAVARNRIYLLSRPKAPPSVFGKLSFRQQGLDVVQLHKCLLEQSLGISDEAIRDQTNVVYIRDTSEAMNLVRDRKADVAFLMNPVRMQQVRDIAFSGDVLPQKSTDFYPKLLSGLTIYALE